MSKLRSVMGTPLPQIRTHNVVFVPVGSHSQQWHTDDSMRKHKLHRYFTVLVHLNTLDNGCGGTEVWSDERQLSDLVSLFYLSSICLASPPVLPFFNFNLVID